MLLAYVSRLLEGTDQNEAQDVSAEPEQTYYEGYNQAHEKLKLSHH